MVRVLLAFIVACLFLSFAADAQAAHRCANGVCTVQSGGSGASGACGLGHRLTAGGPLRNAVGAIVERQPLRSAGRAVLSRLRHPFGGRFAGRGCH